MSIPSMRMEYASQFRSRACVFALCAGPTNASAVNERLCRTFCGSTMYGAMSLRYGPIYEPGLFSRTYSSAASEMLMRSGGRNNSVSWIKMSSNVSKVVVVFPDDVSPLVSFRFVAAVSSSGDTGVSFRRCERLSAGVLSAVCEVDN